MNTKSNETLLKVNNLQKYFPIKKGVFRRTVNQLKAVDGLSFSIKKGETLGLVGESGCGKSTTGRCLIKLLESTDGDIFFRKDNKMINIAKLSKKELFHLRKNIQIIFQDPNSSLDSRMTVRDIIAEPLRIQKVGSYKERTKKVENLLKKVGLSSFQMNRYPYAFSGGQRQRIGIARALSLNPDFIVCDEPVSALDVSVQAQILNLLSDLQEEFNLTYLFIAHDLSVVEHISDRVMVMYLGKIVEMGSSDELYNHPLHPYTEALLQSIPVADPRSKLNREPLEGTVPDPSNPPEGCNFNTRCQYASEICFDKEPELIAYDNNKSHYVACHHSNELNLDGFSSRVTS